MDDPLENIIKYLDNEMSKNERLDFENQIRMDDSLAKEVAFQRGLHGFLKRDKPTLEKKLNNLGDEFIINKQTKKRAFPYWIALFTLLIILLISYFSFFNRKDLAPTDNQNPPKIEEIIPIDEIEKEPKGIIEDSIKPIDEVENSIQTPPTKPEKIIPNVQPIAVLDEKAYERNEIMEDVIVGTYRSDDKEDSMIVIMPKNDAILKYSESILFKINGYSKIYDDYQLIVYSNSNFDIENDHRILNQQIDGKLINDQYILDFSGNLSLEKGLYYLVIKKGQTREILHISRFTVE